ncbi:MAG: ABC-2 family transporter protein [Candidatus Woesearchaeota archaeon]|jgi:ABC-2 type transport system permease protein
MVVKHIKMYFEYFKIAASTAMEYRINFIMQVISMAVNDFIWVIFWFFIFRNFNNIAGWTFKDMILLWAIVATSYGISGLLFGNRSNIADIVVNGGLDFYLTLPKNVLFHLLVSRISWFCLGDVVFGVIVSFFVLSVSQIPLFLFLLTTSTIITVAFGVITGSLSFFIGDSRQTSKTLWMSILCVATYPSSVFSGFAKILIFTILPAAFISGVPVELLRTFSLQWFFILIGFTILISLIAIVMFYAGLRRYESGNQGFVRM